jgi:CitMHS family citrate-Mg2+:H+ or citrate-Ca2+:H+ symporter
VLTFLAFGMVIVFMTLIMTKRMSPLIALILVPIIFGIVGGFWKGLGGMMLDGIRNLAPTGVMLMFAILYFGIMIDGRPVRAVRATDHPDRARRSDEDRRRHGSARAARVTRRRRLDDLHDHRCRHAAPLPAARHSSAHSRLCDDDGWWRDEHPPLGRTNSARRYCTRHRHGRIFIPLVPAMIVGATWVLFVAYRLGLRERMRPRTAGQP